MDNETLLKLAEHFKKDGYKESSQFIKLIIGNDGQSGIVKSIESFCKENGVTFSLASIAHKIKVTEFKKENDIITFNVGLNIIPGSIEDNILSGIVLVVLSAITFGLVEEDK
jgi:hypothetical protein